MHVLVHTRILIYILYYHIKIIYCYYYQYSKHDVFISLGRVPTIGVITQTVQFLSSRVDKKSQ